jgi:hypothetical protein
MRVGGHVTKVAIKKTIKNEVLKRRKQIAARLGYKFLQRPIIKYAVPFASIEIGAAWNYASTRTVSRIARKHFVERRNEGTRWVARLNILCRRRGRQRISGMKSKH